MPDHLDLTYRARGGRLPVDLDLRLRSDGRADLFLGSSYSIPVARVSRVGSFGGEAPAGEVAALRAYLADHDLLARGGSYGQPTPESPGRFLEIGAGGRTAHLQLIGMTDDDEIDGFEQALQRLALALTECPIRALEAALDLRRDGDRLAATIALRSVGTEPMTALLVDPAQPTMRLRARVDLAGTMALPSGATLPMAMGQTELSADAVAALVQEGALPSGIVEMPPGAAVRVDLPPLSVPPAAVPVTATGVLDCWLPEGQARRRLTVLSAETPLP